MASDKSLDTELTTGLLATCLGIELQVFPKTYPIFVSPAFKCYILISIVCVLFITGYNVALALFNPGEQRTEVKMQIWFAVVFNIVYFAGLFIAAWYWFPTKITRTTNAIAISFKGAKDQHLPIDSIREIRAISNWSCTDMCYMCKNYTCRKVFWGMPTSVKTRLIIVTHTCCANYSVSMTDQVMADFLKDNSPRASETNGGQAMAT